LRAKDITCTDIDGILGSNTAAAATVTTLNASSTVSLDGGNVTINDSSASVDFRVESNGHANALFVDGSEDHVGIKTATPAYDLDVGGSTDALRVPVGTTGQRPTAATGIIRYNSTTGAYEGSTDGSTFVNFAIAGAAPTFTKESATGDGSTTTFSGFFSSAPESANNVFVYIDNVYQEPTENYTVSGTNITFTSAPHSAARIFAITGADGTSLVTGGVARSETSSVNFTSSATNIMTFNGTTYRSAEIFIQLTDTANTEYAAMKGVVVHNGTTAFITVHGITNTGSTDLATITANYNSGTVEVKATSTGGTTAAKVQYSLVAA
jgi:prepilin-type processing-associated H-X9-DG protein